MHRRVYRVDRMRTMREIAEQFHMTQEQLLRLNGLGSEEVYVGMRLLVGDRDGVTHVVRPFETLERLAAPYGVTAEQIRADNALTARSVFLGQQLYIRRDSEQS